MANRRQEIEPVEYEDEPTPSAAGIARFQELYARKYGIELEGKDAYRILRGLMWIIWKADQLGIEPAKAAPEAPDEKDPSAEAASGEVTPAEPEGEDSGGAPEAPPGPPPKERAPRWDCGLPARKNRKIGYARDRRDSSGFPARPKAPKVGRDDFGVPSPS